MRILMVTPMPPQAQAPGAIPLVLHAELLGLMRRHQITLLTVAGLEPGEQEAVNQLMAAGVDIRAVRRMQLHGWARWQRRLKLAASWMGGRFPWRTIWFREPGLQKILDQLLAENNYDMVLVEDNAMGSYTFKTTIPRLYTEHEVRRPRKLDFGGLRQQNVLRWILKELDWARWPRYQRSVWHKFTRIQVFSQRDADAVAELAPDLKNIVRVNPFGIEIPDAANIEMEEKNSLLFVGNFTHPPNVDAAVWLGKQIMPLLRVEHPGICLWLVGIYPPQEVKDLACEDIHVTGPVAEIEPYFDRAAVVVAPVRIGGGMRMKVLQAMALGKAVVTTSRGSDGLAVGNRQPPVMVANDSHQFSDTIVQLLLNDDLRRKLGEQARAYVLDYFSPQAYASRIESIYADIHSERGKP